jgi:ATP synthase protein I
MATSIGVPLAVLVSSGALGGAWLDKKWGTAPWAMLVGILLGVIAAFVNMVQVALRMSRSAGSAGEDGDETRDARD